MLPLSGFSSPASVRRNVVFPRALAPMIPRTMPLVSSPPRALSLKPGYVFAMSV